MARIFLALAMFAVSLLVLNAVLGWMGGDYNAAWRKLHEAGRKLDEAERRPGTSVEVRSETRREFEKVREDVAPYGKWATVHRLVGLAAALVTVLVNSITVTYFIGTARWCREVVETYGLDLELARQSEQFKRKSFPWAAAGITIVIGLAALGAAADPSGNYRTSPLWVMPHYVAAVLGIAIIAYSFLRQVGYLGGNFEVIEQILAGVEQVRVDRGLDRTGTPEEAGTPGQAGM